MIEIILVLGCVLSVVGTSLYVSKKNLDKRVSEIKNNNSIDPEISAENKNFHSELNRFDEFKNNLKEVQCNIQKLDIPFPDNLNEDDDRDSSLNKLSKFFEKYSEETVGAEQLILQILPISQTGECLMSIASVLHEALPQTFYQSTEALKNGIEHIGSVDPNVVNECLHHFCSGFSHYLQSPVHDHILQTLFADHEYFSAISKPLGAGLREGLEPIIHQHEIINNTLSPIHENIGAGIHDTIENCMDSSNIDISGHIPYITLALSSYREINLLIKDKTDFISSLKNITLDVGGAGLGATAGAKMGGVIGGLIGGPAGAIFGAIGGAIFGAIGGRKVSDKIKLLPLNNAIEHYEQNLNEMKKETTEKSKYTLTEIHNYTLEKRTNFKNNSLLENLPSQNDDIAIKIGLVLYQSLISELQRMEKAVEKIKKSIWYSSKKHGIIVYNYCENIQRIKKQMPSINEIKSNPSLALNSLIVLQIPNINSSYSYKKKIVECRKELNELNNNNNSSLLIWGYMINDLYQKTINEITDFSNEKMKDLNNLFKNWEIKIKENLKKINTEKDKLGR